MRIAHPLCLVAAHCSQQTVTKERAAVIVTHVDGDTIEILAALTDPTKLDSLTSKEYDENAKGS
ncbi:MAG: hypothetical protein KDN22_01770 [Verrucomicrobiae bacterium]|nr:hypothetical protein [Verrucomicrobiae bacterium]